MYEAYFGLRERPFSIAPDPQYLYMSERHQEAFAHLSYGIQQGGGFVKLTGEVGTGKTTLCRSLLTKLPKGVDVALILNPRVNERELLETICDEFRILYMANSTVKILLDLLNQHLLRSFSKGKTSVLIIDEAQLLEIEVLEMVRLLTNLETNKAKLLQIILIGQPELDHVLAREDLRQLDQRINARYHLGPLNKEQVAEYVNYRLGVAGCQRALFSRQAIRRIFRLSRGVPRIINVLCDHSLLRAYASNKDLVNASLVSTAAREVLAARRFVDSDKALVYGKAIAATVLVAALAWTIPKYIDYRSLPMNEIVSTDSVVVPNSPPNIVGSALVEETTDQMVEQEPVLAAPESEEPLDASDQGPLLATVRSTEQDAPSEQELDSLLSDWSAQDDLTDLTQDTGIARVTLPSLLAIHPDKFDRDSAYESLATLWGVRLSLDESQFEICDAVRAVELECLPGKGDWQSVERFDRPGVLVLTIGTKSIRLVLQSIAGEVVTVRLSGTSYELDKSEIDQYWNGQYMVFWKPPPVDSEQLVPGKRGAAVIWLRQRLDLALRELGSDGLGDINNPEYNQALFNGVRAFQRGNGLESDGVAGRDTLMVLNTYLEKNAVPSL